MDAAEFVRAHTTVGSPVLVPEIQLRLADEITSLWYATQEFVGGINSPPPYWGFAWSAGQGLARYVLDHPETVKGKRVLDFGSGSGLVGIAAVRAGAASVSAAEIDVLAQAAIAANAALNGVTISVESSDLIGGTDAPWDVVLAGDLCYERALAERLIP